MNLHHERLDSVSPVIRGAVLRLCDQQVLALDDPLEQHLPEAQAAQPGVTLRALLCHSAGLPMEVSPRLAAYAAGLDWAAISTACDTKLDNNQPATKMSPAVTKCGT